jgi:RNA polymerase sigma-70 factor (ECF subfamily)
MTAMDRESELTVIDQLRRGDEKAFDAVYDAFYVPVLTFLLRLSRRRDVAEDLIEETWLRLVTHAHRLRPDTRLGPWLFTVARNLHVSYLRSRLLEDSTTAGLMTLWPVTIEQSSPFEATAASELERRIERALATLPAASREVLLLVGIAGLDHSEAAEVCGISAEALRQRLHRARAMLARALETETHVIEPVLREVTP